MLATLILSDAWQLFFAGVIVTAIGWTLKLQLDILKRLTVIETTLGIRP